MEEVCERNNLVKAWKQVRGNKGSPGVDGKTIGDTLDALREHWPAIRDWVGSCFKEPTGHSRCAG